MAVIIYMWFTRKPETGFHLRIKSLIFDRGHPMGTLPKVSGGPRRITGVATAPVSSSPTDFSHIQNVTVRNCRRNFCQVYANSAARGSPWGLYLVSNRQCLDPLLPTLPFRALSAAIYVNALWRVAILFTYLPVYPLCLCTHRRMPIDHLARHRKPSPTFRGVPWEPNRGSGDAATWPS